MPYYAWNGVTLTGNYQKGTVFSRSEKDLEQYLLKQDIALVGSKQYRVRWWQHSSVPLSLKIHFFRQLATLLASGVFLSQALDSVSQGMKNSLLFQKISVELADKVQQGTSFSVALAGYDGMFDTVIIQMVAVGEQTGTLAATLTTLCHQLEAKRDWQARIRSALVLPIMTFCFFMCCATLLLVCIVPRFITIFEHHKAELPYATKQLIALSAFVSSYHCLIGCVVLCVLLRAVCRYAFYAGGKQITDRYILRIPWLNTLVRTYVVAQAFRALVMLITQGVQVVEALRMVRLTTAHTVLKEQLLYVEYQMRAGVPMSQAMQQLHAPLFDEELIAAVRIGEKSGNAGAMLQPTVDEYAERVKLTFVTSIALLNPILMVAMGLLVAFLIIAVYLPVFSLASSVSW